MKRWFAMLVCWLWAIRVGFRGMFRIQLGSQVWHDGRLWYVSNHAGQPYMSLSAAGSRGGKGGEYKEFVPREEIKAVVSLSEMLHRFRFMYRWYMGYWFSSDVNARLEVSA